MLRLVIPFSYSPNKRPRVHLNGIIRLRSCLSWIWGRGHQPLPPSFPMQRCCVPVWYCSPAHHGETLLLSPRRLDEQSVHHAVVVFYSSITGPQSMSFQIRLVHVHVLACFRATGGAIAWIVIKNIGEEELYSRPLTMPKYSSNIGYGKIIKFTVLNVSIIIHHTPAMCQIDRYF